MLDIVTKWGKCFLFYKMGQVVLQSRVGITEWYNFYYKMAGGGGGLQSGAIITKKDSTYKGKQFLIHTDAGQS